MYKLYHLLIGIFSAILIPIVLNTIVSPLIESEETKKYLLWLTIIFFLATVITWFFKQRSDQADKFDLYKATNQLKPEDLGFIVLAKGMISSPNECPYYEGYVSRTFYSNRNSDKERGVPTTDPQVLERIKRGESILLVGQPTEGKTRTAYEMLRGLSDFMVVSVEPSTVVPTETESFKIFKNKSIVIFIDDLSNYIGRSADLDSLYIKSKGRSQTMCYVSYLP